MFVAGWDDDMKNANYFFLVFGFFPAGWFIIFVTLGGWLSPGYSSFAQQASELTLVDGAPKIIVDLAALGSSIFLAIFGVGLWRVSGKLFAFGAFAWILFALSMASNGIWVMGNRMHGAYGLGLIVMVAPALSMVEIRTLAEDGRTYWITGFISFLGVFYFWLNVLGFDPMHYRGLTQRIYATATFLWPAWAAYRLVHGTSAVGRSAQVKNASRTAHEMR